MNDYRELLGWYQDWPDGNSVLRIWFNANGEALGAAEHPSDHDLLNYLVDKGQILDVRYDPYMHHWVVLGVCRDGKPYRDTSPKLHYVLVRVLRNGHPEGDK